MDQVAGVLTFRDRAGLADWLRDKPDSWARSIACRASLRALPSIAEKNAFTSDASARQRLLMAVARANFLAWAACKYPEQDFRSGCAAAASAAYAMAGLAADKVYTETGSTTYADAGSAVAAAAYAADANSASTAASAAYSASVAYANRLAASAIWESVGADIAWLATSTLEDNDEAAWELVGQPLWMKGAGDGKFERRDEPYFAKTTFNRLNRDREIQEAGSQIWLTWYQSLLLGPGRHGSFFGPRNDTRIASQPDQWWRREPQEINRAIALLISMEKAIAPENSSSSSDRAPSVAPPPKARKGAKAGQKVIPARRRSGAAAPPSNAPKMAATPAKAPPQVPQPAINPAPASPPPVTATETTYIEDSHDPEVDYLGRADLAFVLAAQLNQVWDRQNPAKPAAGSWFERLGRWFGPRKMKKEPAPGFVVHIDAPWGGGKTSFANLLIRLLNPYRVPGNPPFWMRQLQLGREMFWPAAFRRPWHIVTFNAWQHQHVQPPWWVFYHAIHRQTADAILSERLAVEQVAPVDEAGKDDLDALLIPQPPSPGHEYAPLPLRSLRWLWCWIGEIWWRFWTPDIRKQVAVTAAALVIAYLLFRHGFTTLDANKNEVGFNFKDLPAYLSTLLAILVGGAPLIRTVMSTVTSTLLPGTPDAAKNYSLGSGDPLDRFRRHFGRQMARLKRPVLVVVDDLDRCKPEFVVELIAGMQTILKSPRVIFVLLGDRDWIEECFTKANDAMKGIEVGPEHEFGARFVEKAIQLSFVLPDITDERRGYVRSILGIEVPGAVPKALSTDPVLDEALRGAFDRFFETLVEPQALKREAAAQVVRAEIEQSLDDKGLTDAVNAELGSAPGARPEETKRLRDVFDRMLSLRAAADKTADSATRHRLEPLSAVLPPNPRQIKRIINAISLLQEVARLEKKVEPGGPEWRALALWIILMIEWPKTWFTLTTWPGLANKVLGLPDHSPPYLPEKDADAFVAAIKAKPEVMAILGFGDAAGQQGEWQGCRVRTQDILMLREILPAVSGKALEVKPAKPPKQEEEIQV